MEKTLDNEMLDALELFHYSYQFRHSLFVLVIRDPSKISEILIDLRILLSSHISILIICENTETLQETLEKLNERGLRFKYFTHKYSQTVSSKKLQELRKSCVRDELPVLTLEGNITSNDPTLEKFGFQASRTLGAHKVFLLSKEPGLVIDGSIRSHLSYNELKELLRKTPTTNISKELLELISEESANTSHEAAVLEAKAGSLFQEIFTHEGVGTLITNEYTNIIRPARDSDVLEIALLLKPWIEQQLILPITQDKIAEEIESYYVQCVNDAIVATAKLIDYGDSAEIGKICTLPRFQGRGRASKLTRKLIEAAEQQGKKFVFSLSIEPKMWLFLKNLGFEEIERELLPEKWKVNYDFTRPSKAFRQQF